MPTYEYRCKSCGEHLEVVQSFKDQPLSECPACGGPLRKVFGNIGIAFKGSGFYKTDSRPAAKSAGEGGKAAGAGEASSSSSSGSGSGSGSESGSGSGSGSSSGGTSSGAGKSSRAAAAS